MSSCSAPSLSGGIGKITANHFADELRKRGFVGPAKHLLRFGRIAAKSINFGWPEVPRVDFHEDTVCDRIATLFVEPMAGPANFNADFSKCFFGKFAHGVGLAGG